MLQVLGNILNKDKKLAVGLMSGTSMDGIDAALVEIEGSYKDTRVKLLDFLTVPYTDAEKTALFDLCGINTSRVDAICSMNMYLGKKMGEAARAVVIKSGKQMRDIDFISSHGQTIYHMPEKGATLQIGDISAIAAVTGCVTAGDFRPSDMAYGGQGAPLVPYVDFILFSHPEKGRVLLNIGGISNITALKAGGSENDVWAFDTGPGNVLIDMIIKIGTSGKYKYDPDGSIAAAGSCNEQWLKRIISRDIYLNKKPPKSTGREYYTEELAKGLFEEGKRLGLGLSDIAATVTAYTAETIASQLGSYVEPYCRIDELFVGGGGVHNRTLMGELSRRLDVPVYSMETLGCNSDAKEGIAFAVLGNEFLCGRANNLPGATGADRRVIMGKLALPSMLCE